jgi:hypothetical protein
MSCEGRRVTYNRAHIVYELMFTCLQGGGVGLAMQWMCKKAWSPGSVQVMIDNHLDGLLLGIALQ